MHCANAQRLCVSHTYGGRSFLSQFFFNMTQKKNESPTLTGRHATAQGAVALKKPIEINGVVLTEQAIETLRDIQEQEMGLSMIETLRKASCLVIDVGCGSATDDKDELFKLLSGLNAGEMLIGRLLPYSYTIAKEEVCYG